MKKAEALKTYGEAARMQMIVERLPDLARAFAEPLASIDKVSILEMGGGGNGHATGVNRFVGNVGGGMVAMSEFLKSNFDIDLAEMVKGRGAAEGQIGEAPGGPAARTDKPPARG
ncbi:MAG TPA: flotillin domain-containing protein, partial [Candidatus Eisenbacteria bacterium]